MLPLRFIVSAPQVLFAQHSHEVLTTKGSSSKSTDAFSPSPVNAPLRNSLVHIVEKRANKIGSTFTMNHLKGVLYLGRFELTLPALLFAISITFSSFS
jgi:hypothetical protein